LELGGFCSCRQKTATAAGLRARPKAGLPSGTPTHDEPRLDRRDCVPAVPGAQVRGDDRPDDRQSVWHRSSHAVSVLRVHDRLGQAMSELRSVVPVAATTSV